MTGLDVMNENRRKNRAARLKKAKCTENDIIQYTAKRISYIRNRSTEGK